MSMPLLVWTVKPPEFGVSGLATFHVNRYLADNVFYGGRQYLSGRLLKAGTFMPSTSHIYT